MTRRSLSRRLLVLLASVFLVSAWLYCLATMHATRTAGDPQATAVNSGLMRYFRDHGGIVLAIELVALAVCAVILVAAEHSLASRVPGNRTDDARAAELSGNPQQSQSAIRDEVQTNGRQ